MDTPSAPDDPVARNTLGLVSQVVGELVAADFCIAVFGGWAEELLQLSPPRPHRDIDLLVFEPEMSQLDKFVAVCDELIGKRFSHKRAFLVDGVMVELFLISEGVSIFWDTLTYHWPNEDRITLEGMPVAPATFLTAYRGDYAKIRAGWPG